MKTGLITGCSRGIGQAIASLLIEEEHLNIIGTSTSGTSSLSTTNFKCFPLNLAQSDSIAAFARELAGVTFDFVINNAAILLEDWNESTVDMEQLKKTFDVNLFGTIELTELLLPLLNDGAHIINISSDWGSFSENNFDAFQPHYKMSKAALNMYTKLLAKRLESRNIMVSSMDPGWTQTDMGGEEASRQPSEVAEDVKNLLERTSDSGLFWHQGKVRAW